jgi:hypothetical protein
MVLVERETGLPLDLVVLINTFLPKIITDTNFKQVIDLWFDNQEECKFRFGHVSNWNTSCVTNMSKAFENREVFQEDLSRQSCDRYAWDVFWSMDIQRKSESMGCQSCSEHESDVPKYSSFRWRYEPMGRQQCHENELDVSRCKRIQQRSEWMGFQQDQRHEGYV